MWYVYNKVSAWANELSSQQWFWVLIGVTVIGAFCMRGFGSRSKY
jgi:hypothetical protein